MTVVEILERLVGFDTTSVHSNLPLIDWVSGYLDERGVESVRLPDPTGTKASLVARIGPSRAGGGVLCGHTDVVPADATQWTRPPFHMTQEGTKLYGRGTTDMKGFIACVLAAVPELVASPLTVPMMLAFTYDEEVGCLGAPGMADYLRDAMPDPCAVIVGEPTAMQVVRAHKGLRLMHTIVTGRSAHSSRTDEGVSAIAAMARLVNHLSEMASVLAVPSGRDFVPPHTTINVGTINGGQAVNIVPDRCEIMWECRVLPGTDAATVEADFRRFADEEVLPSLRVRAPDASITTEVLADIPALDPAGNESAATLVGSLAGLDQLASVSYATDGAAIQLAGLPTVVVGPGSMAQGHRPDEYVEIEQLEQCSALLEKLRVHFTARG
jgi:acetylornithine deacetylase